LNADANQQSQLARNCRSISRFLTRPWQGTDGRLFHYDFEADGFGWSTTQSLFAVDPADLPEVDAWVARTIEGPLNAIRARLSSGDPTALDDGDFFKAAVLMLWLLDAAVHVPADESVRQDLNTLAALSAGALDRLVASIKEDLALRLVFTTSAENSIAPLFVPSSGTFAFTFVDKGCVSGRSIGIGLPLDVHCALIAVVADKGGDGELALLGPALSNFSIGSSQSTRVVLPPNLLGTLAEPEAARILKEQRQQCESLVSELRDVRQLVLQALAEVGVHPHVDRTGRIVHRPSSGPP
jgi:hypothetical protein